MNVLAERNGKTYGSVAIHTPGEFLSPFPGVLFPCLIWDHDGSLTETQRTEVARQLLQAGCRYAVCGGHNCEAWHDAVDVEFVRQHVDDSEATRDSEHVMTTWHDDESPDEVAFFFVLNTNFDDHDFAHLLIVHVGDGHTKAEVEAAVRRYAVNK